MLKGICLIGVKKFFVIDRIKKTIPWTYLINDLNSEEITGTFYENELQKTNQKEFRIEKVIKRKGDTDKLKTVPDDLAKLSNAVKNEVVKKIEYNTLKN